MQVLIELVRRPERLDAGDLEHETRVLDMLEVLPRAGPEIVDHHHGTGVVACRKPIHRMRANEAAPAAHQYAAQRPGSSSKQCFHAVMAIAQFKAGGRGSKSAEMPRTGSPEP